MRGLVGGVGRAHNFWRHRFEGNRNGDGFALHRHRLHQQNQPVGVQRRALLGWNLSRNAAGNLDFGIHRFALHFLGDVADHAPGLRLVHHHHRARIVSQAVNVELVAQLLKEVALPPNLQRGQRGGGGVYARAKIGGPERNNVVLGLQVERGGVVIRRRTILGNGKNFLRGHPAHIFAAQFYPRIRAVEIAQLKKS